MTSTLAKHNLDRNAGGNPWQVRRRIIVITLIFCAALVTYITFKGTDSRTAETIVQSAFYLAGAVIGSYIFGAAWQDRAAIDNLSINTGNVTDIGGENINNGPNTNPKKVDNPDQK